MRKIASFVGSNRDFRPWLAAQRYPGKVVSLAEWRRSRNKKAAKKAARVKPYKPSIA